MGSWWRLSLTKVTSSWIKVPNVPLEARIVAPPFVAKLLTRYAYRQLSPFWGRCWGWCFGLLCHATGAYIEYAEIV